MLTKLVARAPLFDELRRRGHADDLVQDTLLAVTRRLGKGPVEDPFTYAARCVENLARRTYVRSAREQPMVDESLELFTPLVEDVAERVEQRMVMADVLAMIRSVNAVIADLDPVDLELVKAELARTDQKKLAARLGLSRPTLYRRKGPAVARFVAAVAKCAGTSPCESHAGALLAAAGLSGFEAAKAAAEHAATCAECAATIKHLAVARHGLAIIAPIPLVADQTVPGTVFERLWAPFDTITDWARSIVVRAGDPTPVVGGSATKTVALMAAACTGGGGLLCAMDGVPTQLTAPFAPHHAQPHPQHQVIRKTSHAAGGLPRIVAVARVGSGVGVAVQTVGREEQQRKAAVRKAQVAEKRRRAAVAAAAAAKRRRAQAAREFAARQTATPATQEFTTTTAAAPAATITRREFLAPATTSGSGGSAAAREFGAP
jgi:RNA polymerase sigma factor (sigma-70 family)